MNNEQPITTTELIYYCYVRRDLDPAFSNKFRSNQDTYFHSLTQLSRFELEELAMFIDAQRLKEEA